jgi:ribonuclease BN (tRNA processing enzyme)
LYATTGKYESTKHRNIGRNGGRPICNLVVITHSHAEFVIDFVNVMPGMPKSKVKSRIILTPQHAKRLMHAVMENVQRYEDANGEIKELGELAIPLNFGGPAAQA